MRVKVHDVKKSVWSSSGKNGREVARFDTNRAAEGLETIEMESLQRKFVFYYLYDQNKHLEKRFPWANDDVIQRFQTEFEGEEMQLEKNQHCSTKIAKHCQVFSFKMGSLTHPCTD